jgi:hypothetical protein
VPHAHQGSGKPVAQPRGRALWPKARCASTIGAITTATLLLRAGVDAHRVQRLCDRDVRTTTTIYGLLGLLEYGTLLLIQGTRRREETGFRSAFEGRL